MIRERYRDNRHRENRVALVLGANGGIGSEVMRALLRHGWQVRALARKAPSGADAFKHPYLEWREGDAMRSEDVVDAAYGASVIVHAVNPANYHNWRGLALPMLDNTIAAAALFKATVLLPGTIYNYDKDAFPLLREESPQNPQTHKGGIRTEMEERLRDASWDRIRALVVRSGDFFGPRGNSSWLTSGMIRAGNPIRFVFNPGPAYINHSWAYLPDVAEAMVRLLQQRHAMPAFDTYHFRGHVLRNREMVESVCRAAGISSRRAVPFPWWAIRAGAPFVELCKEMLEMRNLWNTAIELDNAKLRARIGNEPQTPLADAIADTLIGCGCIRDTGVSPAQADLSIR